MSKNLIVGDVKQELAGTRRLLERVPDEHLAWKPHEKSFTLGELATHLVSTLSWQAAILSEPEFDLATVPPRRQALASRAAMLEEFDGSAGRIDQALAAIDEDGLAAEWTLRRGDQIRARQPRALALRAFGISHMVHHRAQLGVYLRLLNVPLPALYGPTADE
jgi:uncharacterized damage-inducible protein DinB